MKIDLRYILLIATCAILAWMMSSCNTQKPLAETISNTEVNRDSTTNTTTEITTTETTKESDKAYTIDADSAYTALSIHCDSLGNAYISAIEQMQGKHTDLEFQLKNNKLQIKAIQEEYEIIVHGLYKEIERLESEKQQLSTYISTELSQEKQEPVIVKEVPAWVEWVKWLAVIGAGFILYYVIRFGLWVYRKFVLHV